MAMFKALLRIGVAAGAKAAAEPTRREAIASFMLTIFCWCGKCERGCGLSMPTEVPQSGMPG